MALKSTHVFGATLRHYRQTYTNLTMADFAERLPRKPGEKAKTVQYISLIELGDIAPPMPFVEQAISILKREMHAQGAQPRIDAIELEACLTQAAVDTRIAHWRQRLNAKAAVLREATSVYATA